MANKNFKISLIFDAKTGKVSGDLRKLNVDLKKVGNEAETSLGQIDKTSKKASTSVQELTTFAGKAFAVWQTFRAGGAILGVADQMQILDQRIKTATRTTGDYAEVNKELYRITQQNGSAFKTTVSLFQNISRSAPELNATNKEVLQLVKLVQQLGRISGASQYAMDNALLQFGQAMAGGILRAEEFNSIVENTPEIANRIAQGMGKTVGQLRLAVLEGEVLSKEVFDSLLSQSEEINHQTKELAMNMSVGWQKLKTSAANAIDQINTGFGDWYGTNLSFTEALGMNMDYLSKGIDYIFQRQTELESIDREILELKNEINKGQSIFGNSFTDILARQRELRGLEAERLQILGAVNKLTRSKVPLLDLEAEHNANTVSDLDKQLDLIEQQFAWMEARSDKTAAFRSKEAAAVKKAIELENKLLDVKLKQAESQQKEMEDSWASHQEEKYQTSLEYAYAQEMLDWDRADAYDRYLERIADAEKASLDQRTREYEQMVERIDSVFVDVWRDVIDGTDTAFDAIANMFKQLLAEMAHEAITKPIMLEIIGKDGSSGGLFGGDIGSIFSGGFDLSNIDFSKFFKGQTDIGSVLSYGSYGYNASGGDLISTAGAALGGYFGGPIGAAIGGEFGGLGLKTASRALFGGDWRLKTDDLRFDYDREDGLDASRYVYQKKSGGLLSSTKKKRRYYDMPEIETAYSDMVGSMLDVLDTNANQLGFDLADDFSTYFAKSIKNKSDSEIQQVIADSIETIFSRAIDSMQGLTDFTDRFAQGEENTSDTLQRLLVQFDSISASTAMVNQAIGELDQTSVEAANNITQLAGGLDALNAATTAYYQAYFSEQEQFFDLYDGLSESLNSVYLALPTTRDGFRDLVESLDLSTQASQAQYTTLLNLSSAADSYYTQLESAQTEYYQRQIEIVETSLDALSDIKSALESTFESIVATVNPLSYMDAQTSLSGMLSGARAGSLPTLEALAPVLSVLSSNSAKQYASYTDFERDQLVTANMVEELTGYTDNAISIEQQMLSELQLHTNQLSGLDDSIVNLTDVMTLMSSFEQRAINEQELFDVIEKIDSMQSIYEANVDKYQAADLLLHQGVDKDEITAQEEAAYAFIAPAHYAQIIDRVGDFQAWYSNQLDSGGSAGMIGNVSTLQAIYDNNLAASLVRELQLSNLYEEQSLLGSMIDGSHATGLASVPFDGYTAELHKDEAIIDARTMQGLRKYGVGANDNGALLSEIKAMRKELTQLQEQSNRINMSIANSNTVVAKYAKRADVIGYKVEVSNP